MRTATSNRKGPTEATPGGDGFAGPGLAALVEAQALRAPEAVAVEDRGVGLDYQGLDRRANRLAHVLRGRGVSDEAPVGIGIERSLDMIVAVLAVLKAGGTCVPLDPAYPPARREAMMADSGARWLLARGETSGPGGAAGGPEVLPLDRMADEISQASDSRPEGGASTSAADPLVYVIYTSGSTGTPKGVMLPQRALANLVDWQIARPRFRPAARTLQFSSLSFDVSFQEIFSTWASGGTLVLVDDATRRDPGALLDHLIRHRVERLFLPFVALRGLAEAAVTSGRLPEALREVYTAGEQLQVDDTLRAFFAAMPACLLENQYGPSEAHVVTAHPLEGPPSAWPALPPIGRPVANAIVRVLDEQRRPVPPGGRGEIFIGGVCLARGYLGKPEMTAERFVTVDLPGEGPVRLYRTGDLGEWLEDGSLQFHGRIDQQVKFRGYRIEPGEIAAVLGGHPSVAQCVAAVRSSGGRGQRLVAYVLPREGAVVSPEALAAYARERLPAHMVPSQFPVVASFPLTPSGKIDVKALPEPVLGRRASGIDLVAPRTPDELALARLWGRVLGLGEVGVRDDFFDLGGDSIMAAELMAAIRRELGREVTLGMLAAGPTIESLAAKLGGGGGEGRWRSLVPIRTGGSGTPIFCVHGGAGNVASFPLLARQLPDGQPFYGLQWDGLGSDTGRESIPAMAALYVSEIRSVQPRGPYLLAGHCIGGLIACEMARQLAGAGETVARVFLIDSPHLSSPDYRPGRRKPPLLQLFAMKKDRRALAEIWLRRLVGMPVRPRHRPVLAVRVMVAAAWKYRLSIPAVPATLIATGLGDGGYLGLAGTWGDGAMGWTHLAGRDFRIQRVEAEHSEVVYDPRTAGIFAREVAAARAGGGVRD